MKKHIISLLVLFLLVSTSLVGVSNQVTDDSFMVQEDSYQYMMDWSVHLTNQTTSEETSGPSFNYVESRSIEPSPLSGPMDSPWSMFSHDAFHTGRSSLSTENNPGVEIWRVKGNYPGEVWSSAVIDNDDIVYFGTIGGDSSLYALYPNGTIEWRYQSDGRIWCTPAIAEDGTLYFTTWGGYGYMHAVYPNGTMRWLYHDGYDSSSLSSPTIGNDGTIYFGSEECKIYAVNPDGTEKWRYTTTGSYVNGAAAIGEDGIIYIGSSDHYLYALNSNGTLRWKFNAGGEIKGSPTIAPDGTIYVPSFGGYFYALYPNGTMKWKASTGGIIALAGVALAEDGTIYVGTEILRAYYPNGTLRWELDIQGNIYGTVPAVSADGTIYVSAGGSLVAVNPDGTERWRKQLTIAQIHSSPCIGEEGRVYVGSETYETLPYGFLHAFGVSPLHAEAYGPYNGVMTEPLQFTGEAFGGTPQYQYHWDFGDGNTSEEQNPTHIYTHRCNYTAILTVTDFNENQSYDTAMVYIGYPLPKITILKPVNALYVFNMKICNLPAPIVIGRITIIVNVTQVDADIDRVEFYYSGDLIYTDTSPPYQCVWRSHPPPYDQDFLVRAYDTVGNHNDKMIYITKIF